MISSRARTLRIEDVLTEGFRPAPNARVSSNSRFRDGRWDFTDGIKARLNSVPDSRLCIDWAAYVDATDNVLSNTHLSARLPQGYVDELKVIAYVYLALPSAFASRGVQSVKPSTAVVMVRALVRLFSDIFRSQHPEQASHLLDPGGHSIADVSLTAIRNAIALAGRADGATLRKGLRIMTSPLLQNTFANGPLRWNLDDIKSIDFTFAKQRTDYEKVLPNDLFRFLSNTACSDVVGFLRFLGREPTDTTVVPADIAELGSISNGSVIFEDYLAIRESDRQYSAEIGRKSNNSLTARKRFKTKYGVTLDQFFKYLYRIQRAAYTVIALYTGARFSDMTTFKTGCIERLHGLHVIRGTVTKGEALDALENLDVWPATPIMRDALECLTQISRATFNPYLISACHTVPIGGKPEAMSLTGLTTAINAYLRAIDVSRRWGGWRIHPHQLRHTLANQLARADVGLVFIAQQMKHLHTALHALPPDVTMMYGNVGELAQQRAIQSKEAYLEAAHNLYDPDKPVAGGGAVAFTSRRKAYFEGMAAQGWTTDEVIENLAKQGLPFASVGVGYCGGKRETLLKDGTKELPPCLGSLQCNPAVCSQAVITRTHKPQWEKVMTQNLTLASDSRMAHAKETLLAAAAAARGVLAQLDTDSDRTAP